jgi:hypothetical protein
MLEGHATISHWNAVASIGDEVQAQDAFGTPVLKPRVSGKIILETAHQASLNDHKNDLLRSPEALAEDRLNHPTQKENKRKRPGSPVMAKRSLPKSKQQSRTENKPLFKKTDSDIDMKDEQAWRMLMSSRSFILR